MFWYSCVQSPPLDVGVGNTPSGYSTVRASVFRNAAPSREYPAPTVVTNPPTSTRVDEKSPVIAFCTPPGVAATEVGATKNGTLVSEQAASTATPATAATADHRIGRREPP